MYILIPGVADPALVIQWNLTADNTQRSYVLAQLSTGDICEFGIVGLKVYNPPANTAESAQTATNTPITGAKPPQICPRCDGDKIINVDNVWGVCHACKGTGQTS